MRLRYVGFDASKWRAKTAALLRRLPIRSGASYLTAVAVVLLLLVLPLADTPPADRDAVPAFGLAQDELDKLAAAAVPEAGTPAAPRAAWQQLTGLLEGLLHRLDGALSRVGEQHLSDWYRRAVALVLPAPPTGEDLSHGAPAAAAAVAEGWLQQVTHQLFAINPTQPLSLVESAMPISTLLAAHGASRSSIDYIVLRPTDQGAGAAREPGGAAGWQYDGENPLILIYHSHTQESFLPEIFADPSRRSPGQAFSSDPARNVLRVGRVLAEHLQDQYGIGVIHVEEYFDLPAGGQGVTKIGSYDRSRAAVAPVLERYPSIRVVLDIHRDAPRRAVTTAAVEGASTAQVMLVVGSGERMAGPAWDWQQNKRFAEQLTGAMQEVSPNLARRQPFVTEFRYNQHLSPGAVLVEIGGVDNTMDEAVRGITLFGDALAGLVAQDQLPPYR